MINFIKERIKYKNSFPKRHSKEKNKGQSGFESSDDEKELRMKNIKIGGATIVVKIIIL